MPLSAACRRCLASLVVAIVGMLAIVACSCDGGEPFDDDVPRRDAGPPPQLTGVLEVLSTNPCPDWVEVAHPDPTPDLATGVPEIVWDWDSALDPLTSGRPRGIADWMTVGPDGAIWARFDQQAFVRLDPDGHATWAQQLDFDPERHYSAEPHLAPDGTAFLVRGFPGEILHIDPRAEGSGITRFTIGTLDSNAAALGQLAIGPGGRVYVTPDLTALVATCRGAEVLWRLAFNWDGEPATVQAAQVTPDGQVSIVVREASRPVFVQPDGTWRSLGTPEQARLPYGGSGVQGLWMDAVYWASGVDGMHLDYFVDQPAGTTRWSRIGETYVGDPRLMDPEGAIWHLGTRTGPSAPATYTRESWTERLWSVTARYCRISQASIFTANSDLLCVGDPEYGLIRIRGTDGSIAWTTTVYPPGPGTFLGPSFANDINGRIYVFSDRPTPPRTTTHIVALRTDATPPRGAYCLGGQIGCNRHRNNWAHDYGAP